MAFLGRYKEAQEVANDLLRNDSTNIEAIYIRGLCLYYEDNIGMSNIWFKISPLGAITKMSVKLVRVITHVATTIKYHSALWGF